MIPSESTIFVVIIVLEKVQKIKHNANFEEWNFSGGAVILKILNINSHFPVGSHRDFSRWNSLDHEFSLNWKDSALNYSSLEKN